MSALENIDQLHAGKGILRRVSVITSKLGSKFKEAITKTIIV
jgi:hypothetical protein